MSGSPRPLGQRREPSAANFDTAPAILRSRDARSPSGAEELVRVLILEHPEPTSPKLAIPSRAFQHLSSREGRVQLNPHALRLSTPHDGVGRPGRRGNHMSRRASREAALSSARIVERRAISSARVVERWPAASARVDVRHAHALRARSSRDAVDWAPLAGRPALREGAQG